MVYRGKTTKMMSLSTWLYLCVYLERLQAYWRELNENRMLLWKRKVERKTFFLSVHLTFYLSNFKCSVLLHADGSATNKRKKATSLMLKLTRKQKLHVHMWLIAHTRMITEYSPHNMSIHLGQRINEWVLRVSV